MVVKQYPRMSCSAVVSTGKDSAVFGIHGDSGDMSPTDTEGLLYVVD